MEPCIADTAADPPGPDHASPVEAPPSRGARYPGRRTTLLRCLPLALATLLLPGCYVYSAGDPDLIPPGEEVRVTVTRDGASELAQVTEQVETVPVIRGRLMERDNQSLMIRVPVRATGEGLRPDIGQVVRVPMGSVLAMEQRDFSLGRTGAFVAGSAGAAALVVFAIIEASGGTQGRTGDGTELFVPLLSFPFR